MDPCEGTVGAEGGRVGLALGAASGCPVRVSPGADTGPSVLSSNAKDLSAAGAACFLSTPPGVDMIRRCPPSAPRRR